MSTNQSFSDTANQLKAESSQISVTFNGGSPTSTTGTVTWTIPSPSIGCGVDSLQYAGAVIVAKNTPITPSDYPQNGVIYTADPTLDSSIHAGDKVGDSIVIGAFYETAKKSSGQPLTTSLMVTDFNTKTPYYICVFPVDSQFRYFNEGIRAYSNNIDNLKQDTSLPSTQTVEFATPIIGSTGTNLTPGFLYTFEFILDTNYDYAFSRKRDPRTSPTAQIFPIQVNGTESGTYDQLLTEIRKQISLIGNPLISPVPPNQGGLYWNASEKTLYEFDGVQHNVVDGVLVEAFNPAVVVNGTMWFEPSSKQLYVYNSGWVVSTYTTSVDDPTTSTCSEFWFNGSQAYSWNGTTWCEVDTILSSTDPSCPTITCGAFWYDETQSVLNKWDDKTQRWVPTSAIVWDRAPNNLTDGTFWFDVTNNQLFTYNGGNWQEETALFISDVQPTLPAIDSFWFNPITEELKQWNGTSYTLQECIVWHQDPTDTSSCDLWWNTVDDSDVLNVWDSVHLEWDEVASFTIGSTDPHANPIMVDGTIWVETTTGSVYEWNTTDWVSIAPILSVTDPTIPSTGSFWYNPETNTFKQWSGTTWTNVDPTESTTDPSVIPTGTYWFNTSNNVLSVRNGMMWLAAAYSSTPLTPKLGDLWYNSSTDILLEWTGSSWSEAEPIITVEIVDGKLIFTSRDVGANIYLGIDKENNNTLFEALQPTATIWTPTLGGDGKSSVPSYLEPGVGTDGSPDERRLIMDNIRRRLGAPTVNVELDQHTLNLCIDRAIEMLRQRSMIYKRGFFFVDIVPRTQVYRLTNRQLGYHKIVNVMGCHRFTSAFMTSAHGSGAYGQVVLQQLYSMGTYDLTSYHLIAQYIEQMEMLFSTRISYSWDEPSRELAIYHSFYTHETMLLDCTVERTEQELMNDRLTKPWIEKWALAEAMFTLAQIRGKFSTLPGASGGVSLNSSDLASSAQTLKDECINEIEDYIVSRPDDLGMESQFVIG